MPFRGLTLSYGLKVFNGANHVIIDGESSTFQTLQVSSSVNSGSGAVSTGALIMGTRTSSGLVGGQTSGATFIPISPSMSWTTLAKTSSLTGIQNTNVPTGAAGDYGLQVRNADNRLCYDSRLHANGLGMSLSNVYPSQSLSGGNIATPNALSQQLINRGALKGSVIAEGFSSTNPPYVSLNSSFTSQNLFLGNNIYWSSFYFDYDNSPHKVYFLNGGYLDIPDIGLGGYFALPNFSTIIVANVLS